MTHIAAAPPARAAEDARVSLVPPGAFLPGLHGLRATAALMVVTYHVHALDGLPVPAALSLVTTHFILSVPLLFVLSAFSLAWSNPQASARPGPYYLKRFFRIAPLFYVMFLVACVVRGLPDPAAAITTLTFVFNLVPGHHHSLVWVGWTVGVEELFYAVLPLLLLLRSLPAVAVATALAMLVGFAARHAIETSGLGGDRYADIAFIGNLPIFLSGLLGFRLFDRVRTRPDRARDATWLAAAAGLAGVAFLLTPFGSWLTAIPGKPGVLFSGLAFASLCLWQALRPSWAMRNRVMQWVAERSYSFYLLHPLLLVALRPAYRAIYAAAGGSPWAFLPCVAVTLAPLAVLAAISYRCIEQPGIRLGRRVIQRWATPDRPAARPAPETGRGLVASPAAS